MTPQDNTVPVIRRCAAPGCRTLTYSARCPEHATPDDAELARGLDEAVVELAIAQERAAEARERIRRLEQRAGIRRA